MNEESSLDCNHAITLHVAWCVLWCQRLYQRNTKGQGATKD